MTLPANSSQESARGKFFMNTAYIMSRIKRFWAEEESNVFELDVHHV